MRVFVCVCVSARVCSCVRVRLCLWILVRPCARTVETQLLKMHTCAPMCLVACRYMHMGTRIDIRQIQDDKYHVYQHVYTLTYSYTRGRVCVCVCVYVCMCVCVLEHTLAYACALEIAHHKIARESNMEKSKMKHQAAGWQHQSVTSIMTHSYVTCLTAPNVTQLFFICDMPHTYLCDMTHAHLATRRPHDSVTSIMTNSYVKCLTIPHAT